MIQRHIIFAVALIAIASAGWTTQARAESVLYESCEEYAVAAPSLDPISPDRFYQVNDRIYSRLIRQDDDRNPSPELATSWSVNDNATERTLTLQEGVHFHDGSDVDAADVKYTLERINDPALESPVASVLGMIDHVEIIDDHTAKIVLSSPHAGLPVLLMDYRIRILPDGSGDTIQENPIGSGPFKLDTYNPETGIADLTLPYPGVPETLARLRDHGHRMAVCANKPDAPTRAVLEALGLAPFFDSVVGGDAAPAKKPDARHLLAVLDRMHATASDAIMIGDGTDDLLVAEAAGVPSILVRYGYGLRSPTSAAPVAIIDAFEDLPAA
ncbi:MAG: ABC transporter substrate-binding protein [Dongiaceae bacterium]